MIQINTISESDDFNLDTVKEMLYKKFDEIDFEDAKKDVIPFIKDIRTLNLWNKNFFNAISSQIKEN